MRSLDVIELGLARLKWLAAAAKFELAMRRHGYALKAGFNPDQPRDDHGRWTSEGGGTSSEDDGLTSGQSTGNGADQSPPTRVAGTVIRVCVAGSRSFGEVEGRKTYWVEYACTGGRTFTRSGPGHYFKAIVLDPFQ